MPPQTPPTTDGPTRSLVVLAARGNAPDSGGAGTATLGTAFGDVMARHGGRVLDGSDPVGLFAADLAGERAATRAALDLAAVAPLAVGVGVHLGEAPDGQEGAWVPTEETVATARRLSELAGAGHVWISRPLFRDLRGHVEALPRPTLPRVGEQLPVQPYEVRREAVPVPTTALPFTGRGDEFAVLEQELERAIDDRTSRIVVVRGAAGIGKSRLLREFRDRLEDDTRLFRFDSVEYDRADHRPAGGLATLLRHRLDLAPDASADTAWARLRSTSTELRPDDPEESERRARFLGFALGLHPPGLEALGADAAWTGVHATIQAWMEQLAARDPWIVVFEDVQVGDAETAMFLDRSTAVGWSVPLLLLVTVRDDGGMAPGAWLDRIEAWTADGRATEVVLDSLPVPALADALATLPDEPVSRGVAEGVAAHAVGHPLFALELVDWLDRGGLLRSDDLTGTTLPPSLDEALAARIERLASPGRELAQRAAFLGRRFTRDAVARIWDGSDDDLELGFEVLRHSQTIFEEATHGVGGVIEEVFRHARLQEVALAQVDPEDRRRWHGRLETWAEHLLAEAGSPTAVSPDVLAVIAHSREEHGDVGAAADWHETIGLLARRDHRFTEAADAFLAAARVTRGARNIVLRQRAADAVAALGDFERALTILDATEDAGGEDAAMGAAPPAVLTDTVEAPLDRWWDLTPGDAATVRDVHRADLLGRSGRVEDAMSAFRACEPAVRGTTTPAAAALRLRWARDFVFFLSEFHGDLDLAEEVMHACARDLGVTVGRHDQPRELIVMQDSIAMRRGDMVLATRTATWRLEYAERTGDLREQSVSWNSMGIVQTALGNLTAAEDAYRHSLTLAQRIGDLRGEAITLHNLGILHLDRAEYDVAAEHQQQYLTASLRIGNHLARSYAPIYLGLAAAGAGDLAAATSYLDDAAQNARRHGWPRLDALARGLAGELLVLEGLRTGDRERVASGTQVIRDTEEGWRGLDEVGELYAVAAVGAHTTGDDESARGLLDRSQQLIHPSWAVARAWLDGARRIVDDLDAGLATRWLDDRRFHRAAWVLTSLGGAA